MQQLTALAQTPETTLLSISILFLILGVFAFGWLVVHVEYSRHRSILKMLFALVIGSILLGFGIHFFLLSGGS